MKTTKRTLANFSFFDQQEIEKNLEKMAAKGWMVCKAGNLFWTYKKIEPQKLRFAVTYFPGASELDPAPSEKQLAKEEFCAYDGWQLVLRWDAMQIFCTDREDAVPIETDPIPHVANIHQTMKKMLTGQFVNIAMLIWFLFMQLSQFWRDPVEYLSGTNHLFILVMWVLLLVGDIFQLYSYFRWQKRAKKAAEDGIFYPMHTNKIGGWGLAIVATILLLLSFAGNSSKWLLMVCMFVLFAVAYFLGRWMMGWMKKKGFSRRVNLIASTICIVIVSFVGVIGIIFGGISGLIPMNDRKPIDTYEWDGRTFDIYDDSIPLEVEDMVNVTARWSKEADQQESILLSYGKYRQDILFTENVGNYEIKYEIVDVKIPALYNFIKGRLVNTRQDEVHGDVIFTDHFEPIDPTLWNAQEVYQLHWSDSILDTYLVCWENRIVEITFFWEPTNEEIVIASEKLRN